MRARWLLVWLCGLLAGVMIQHAAPSPAQAADPAEAAAAPVPRSVPELWADFDPRRDPLRTELVRQWREGPLLLRSVRFVIGKFKGEPARLAAFYGFSADAQTPLPGVMHIHGGGQRASLDEVRMLAARGYAALSVNWGGLEMEQAQPGDPNTDWGAVDPTQTNVPGYFTTLPGPLQLHEDREHPQNNNWYLLTLACRRGLTFLEQQAEVDPARLGIHGYSMGGNLTMYVAGTDARVRVAVAGVGGQGWRWEPHEFFEGTQAPRALRGHLELHRRTLSFESYAPHIACPVLHRGATNDFHGWMDDVYRTNERISEQPLRYSWSPHFNHHLTPEVAVTMPLWLDQFLRGGPQLPTTPHSRLILATDDRLPRFEVEPARDWPVTRCDIYYSVDDDPRARFWRSAAAERDGQRFVAALPLETLERPLAAFANVYYALPEPQSLAPLRGYDEPVREVCLSTLLHGARPDELRAAGIRTALGHELLIDDFRHGWRDWYRLNERNPNQWQYCTRKITDPKWRGPADAALMIRLRVPRPNRLSIVAIENEWRSYRGRKRTFVCEIDLAGGNTLETWRIERGDFRDTQTGAPLESWGELDVLGICGDYLDRDANPTRPVRQWQGPRVELLQLRWQ